MAACLIGFGSNLGDRNFALTQTSGLLSQHPEIELRTSSQTHSTAPIGGPVGQDEFLNAAFSIETRLSPLELLAFLQQVENKLGRQRNERWGARTADLDLLLYDGVIVNTPELTLPHPRMAFRRFVLESAAEAAPGMVHSVIGWTVQQLLDHLNSAANYLAITGIPASGKTDLAQYAAKETSSRLILDPTRAAAMRGLPSGTAGRDRPTEIEFLRQRAMIFKKGATLDKGAFNRERQSEKMEPVVSNFWLGQSLAYARAFQSDEQIKQCEQAWNETRATAPKVIVLLDPPVSDISQQLGSAKPEITQQLERLSEELRRLVMQPQRGPVLHLPKDALDNSLNHAKQETIAAMAAMQ